MNLPRVLIRVSGGVVTDVISDIEIDVRLADYDNMEDSDTSIPLPIPCEINITEIEIQFGSEELQ